MGFGASQRTDVEAARVQRRHQREVIDLGIMRQRRDCGEGVQRLRLHNVLRPFGVKRDTGKTIRRGESRAWIDDFHVISGDLGDRGQSLADMHRANDDQARRRDMDVEEVLPANGLNYARPAGPNGGFDGFAQHMVGDNVAAAHQAIASISEIGHKDDRPALAAFAVQTLEDKLVHGAQPSGSTYTLIRPPQDSPTCQAVSSATPNSSMRGLLRLHPDEEANVENPRRTCPFAGTAEAGRNA
ncbi:protein of unknown function (plasmid) [Shinella sp. WSC3-e]|nr:hypothetical protein SHINE37_100073 [Rhizobiaceae bacterium]CAK7261615.1 protein of unknown function [Shinella sp. WSC3-e]